MPGLRRNEMKQWNPLKYEIKKNTNNFVSLLTIWSLVRWIAATGEQIEERRRGKGSKVWDGEVHKVNVRDKSKYLHDYIHILNICYAYGCIFLILDRIWLGKKKKKICIVQHESSIFLVHLEISSEHFKCEYPLKVNFNIYEYTSIYSTWLQNRQ